MESKLKEREKPWVAVMIRRSESIETSEVISGFKWPPAEGLEIITFNHLVLKIQPSKKCNSEVSNQALPHPKNQPAQIGGGLKYVCSWENGLVQPPFLGENLEDSQKMLLVGYHMTLSAEVMEIDRNSSRKPPFFFGFLDRTGSRIALPNGFSLRSLCRWKGRSRCKAGVLLQRSTSLFRQSGEFFSLPALGICFLFKGGDKKCVKTENYKEERFYTLGTSHYFRWHVLFASELPSQIWP